MTEKMRHSNHSVWEMKPESLKALKGKAEREFVPHFRNMGGSCLPSYIPKGKSYNS